MEKLKKYIPRFELAPLKHEFTKMKICSSATLVVNICLQSVFNHLYAHIYRTHAQHGKTSKWKIQPVWHKTTIAQQPIHSFIYFKLNVYECSGNVFIITISALYAHTCIKWILFGKLIGFEMIKTLAFPCHMAEKKKLCKGNTGKES